MGILQEIEDFQTTTTSTLESNVKTGSASVKDIMEGASHKIVGSLFNGFTFNDPGIFAGMSHDEIEILYGDGGALEKYCADLDSIVKSFNQDKVNAEMAFKGNIKTEIENYVEGTKSLIYAYISNLRQFRKEAKEYAEAYEGAVDADIAEDVKAGVQEINRNAQAIKFDEFGTGSN